MVLLRVVALAGAVLGLFGCRPRLNPVAVNSFTAAVVEALRQAPYDSLASASCTTIEVAPDIFRRRPHTTKPDFTVFRPIGVRAGDTMSVGKFTILFVAHDTSAYRVDRTHADLSLYLHPISAKLTVLMEFSGCNVWEIALFRLDSTGAGWHGRYLSISEP